MSIDLDNKISALAAITAGGSSFWDKFLPAERNTTITTISGFNKYLYLIDKQRPSEAIISFLFREEGKRADISFS